jgi:hypothetical protein
MILLVLSGSNEKFRTIAGHVQPLGFDLVHYCHVQKAMDNLEEINPKAIIVSAQDFPRHWKAFVQFVRSGRVKEICPIFLLTGHNFTTDDKTQASFLGVNRQLSESLADWEELESFLNMLSKHIHPDERRRHTRLVVEPWHRFNFMFVSPVERKIITGDIKTISIAGLAFKPHNPELLKGIAQGAEISECSFRVGGDIYSLACKIARIDKNVSIHYVSLPEKGKRTLAKYLRDISA